MDSSTRFGCWYYPESELGIMLVVSAYRRASSETHNFPLCRFPEVG